jgi:hypothetical protein
LAMASLASATTVSLIAPAPGDPGSATNPLAASGSLRVYLGVSASDLDGLSCTISATNATITGGILAAEAPEYGVKATDYGAIVVEDGGWGAGLSSDTEVVLGAAHVQCGQFGNTIHGATTDPVAVLPVAAGSLGVGVFVHTPIAYIDITADGSGNHINLSIINGSKFGSTSILTDLVTVPDFGETTVVVPEPATMLLLSLGGLLLRRKK